MQSKLCDIQPFKRLLRRLFGNGSCKLATPSSSVLLLAWEAKAEKGQIFPVFIHTSVSSF